MTEEGPFAIGVDVGGTKIAAGLVDVSTGALVVRRSLPTETQQGGPAVLAQAVALVESLIAAAASAGQAAAAIGVSICELVDVDGRVTSGQAVAWEGLPVREAFTALRPTVVEADVRAHAVAEARWGAGRGSRQFVFVSVGTGISCTLVLDGRPYAGARGNALILSSQASALPCPQCGNTDWPALEDFASGPALVARYRAAADRPAERAEDVLAAAQFGDEQARSVVVGGAQALGARLGWLVDVLDPERIVVGGGLGSAAGLYADSLVAAARAHIWAPAGRELPIVPAQLGPDAALVGAAWAAARKIDLSLD